MKIMKVLILIILFGLFTGNVFTQQDTLPPPPSPLIYSAPDKAQIVEFRADRLGFKIGFPGKPLEESESFDNENISIFKSYLKGSNKIVKVTELRFDKSPNINATEIFEQKKLEYLSGENSTLEYEKDISHKNHKGKEFAIKRGYEYQKSRVYVVGNKIYEVIIDVTNWHILQSSYKPKVAEFEAEADMFFDSFEIIPVTVIGERLVAPDKAIVRKQIIQAPKPAADSFNSRTKIFESKDGGFKVYFPIKPERRVNEIEHTYGKGEVKIYLSAAPLFIYGVTYFDAPNALTTDFEKTLNYDRQKDALLQNGKGKLLSEKKFSTDNFTGKDYEVFVDDSVITMRTFFVEQRLFRLLTMSPATNEKNALTRLKTNQSLINKFYSSFSITELPKPETVISQLPEDFAISIENGIFYSGFFDFRMKIPEDFRIFDKEEADFIKRLGLEISESSKVLNQEMIKTSYERTAVLFLAQKEAENEQDLPQILTIAAEVSSFPVFDPKTMGEIFLKNFLEEHEEISINVREELIGGVKFAWVETLDKNDNSKNRIYFANLRGLAFQISYIYTNEADLRDFLELLKTFEFNRQD